MRARLRVLVAVALAIPLLALTPNAPASAAWDGIRAGVAVVDATWHVGAAAGQYSDLRDPFDELAGGDVDPHLHATTKENSYGVASRLTIRAIVVEGTNGRRIALVKSDNYLAQDHLQRRVADLLADAGSQVGYGDILHAATHNHSSPYYATPSWGVWLFQDVVDLRMFEYQARAMADAVLLAEADLAPARMGATVVPHDLYKGNIMRPQVADDGSPAGFPNDYGDQNITLLRFDRRTDAGFEPMAVWMNWGQHPESLDAYDLITADYLGPLERFVERDTGARLVFSQGDVGSAEGPYDSWNRGRRSDGTLVAWAHVGHAQTERGARLLADDVVAGFDEIGDGGGTVPYATHFPVDAVDGWIPGPLSHPYPGVSNCRTDTTLDGDPGLPIVGLPDCERLGGGDELSLVRENLRAHGIPIPDQYAAPGFTAVEENLRLRLQVFRLGEVVIGSCACEAQVDLIRNFESRANRVVGDRHDGFDWATDPHTSCTSGESEWTCRYDDPAARAGRTWTFSDSAYRRWQAQVHNPADGWDDLSNLLFAETEPADPAAIRGNFSTEELDESTGYALAVGVGHAGDYNGYTVSYREYQAYDHYRKALTSYGPHTADHMSTWMVRMARSLSDPGYSWTAELAAVDPTAGARNAADEIRQAATAAVLGAVSSVVYDLWQITVPDDVGPAALLSQPADITRFDGTTVAWRGGSNAVDNPIATVERLVDGEWRAYADMTGEVWTMVDLPDGANAVIDTYTGAQEWIWTAGFEAFTGGPDPALGSTPAGEYRFVIDGHIRSGGSTSPYRLASDPFRVEAWTGVPAPALATTDRQLVATVAAPVYPRSYESPFPFIADDGLGRLVDEAGQPLPDDLRVCKTCTFRAWAFRGGVQSVNVVVTDVRGRRTTVPMMPAGDGTWIADVRLRPGDAAQVLEGGVVDTGGNVNGTPSNVVTARRS